MNARSTSAVLTVSLSAFVLAGCVSVPEIDDPPDPVLEAEGNRANSNPDTEPEDTPETPEETPQATETETPEEPEPTESEPAEDETPQEPEESPAESPEDDPNTYTGTTGYSFTAPDRWVDVTEEFDDGSGLIDLAIASPDWERGEPAHSVNVIVEPVFGVDFDELGELQEESLEPDMTDYETGPTIFGGEDAHLLQGEMHISGASDPVGLGQYTLILDNFIYTVSFGFSLNIPASEIDDIHDTVYDSWDWG